MVSELNIGQQQQQKQQQSLSPAVIKSLQLLSMPYYELTGFLERAVLDNPFLEIDWSMVEENVPLVTTCRSRSIDTEQDFDPVDILPSEDTIYSLKEQLRLQLIDLQLPQQMFTAGEFIIESLDQNGYFTDDETTCAAFLGIPTEEFSKILAIVRTFQPIGIASRDLRKCLLVQAEANLAQCDIYVIRALLQLPIEILSQKNLKTIAGMCSLSMADIKEAFRYLSTLNPRPGQALDSTQIEYVYPDIEVHREGSDITFRFRSGCEILSISEHYAEELLAMDELDTEARNFIRQKYQDAKTLINELRLRKSAVEKLLLYLVDYQCDFFAFANGKLKPLTMKQAAEALGMHPSTVSRCVNGRYILTANGTLPMKSLFSAGLPKENEPEIAPQEIRKLIAAEINKEDPTHPLSDQELTDILVSRNVRISRRTVAKYREQLKIPGSRNRRKR